ncbi:MAG TPA: AgmX/PglI C-terminal domain-containing protein [Steroidobacteraceae bacterium]|nr:AgmX/PglI C-terminal domain-containing protein [Steroidobacteraceae bacterium]
MIPQYYRNYQLAWEPEPEATERLRRYLKWALAILLVFGIGLPFIHLAPVKEAPADAVPPRLAQLMVENRPKPPPPKPIEQPKPEEKPVPKPEVKPVPQVDVRKKVAESKEMKTIKDQLADLRDVVDTKALSNTHDVVAGPDSRSDRSMITSKVGTGSSGITSASSSRGFGSGAGALGTHVASTVTSNIAAAGKGTSTGSSNGKGGRSDEEIELVFDKNKGALYALYARALREQADLQGKLVLELTIAPSGDITDCRVVSSELKDPELEAKIVARVKLFHFEAKDVNPVKVTKPIEFFPA